MLDEPLFLENAVVEEPHRADRLIERAPRHVAVDEMRLVPENVFGPEHVRRFHEELGHPFHAVQINRDRFLAVPADRKLVAHPFT